MELSEKKWAGINRLFSTEGERSETTEGVKFIHSRIPFVFQCRQMRISNSSNLDNPPVDLRWYRFYEWIGRDWVARRTYVEPNRRANPDVQTSHELTGNVGHAEEDMVLALLLVKATTVR